MSVTVSTMGHAYSLVEDWLELDHWSTYGATDRDYEVRRGVDVGIGSALWVGPDGALRINRETAILPGTQCVLTYQAYCLSDGRSPCSLQIRGSQGSQFTNIVNANSSVFNAGWNKVIVNFTAPEEWGHIRLALFTTAADGGLIGPIRAVPADMEETA